MGEENADGTAVAAAEDTNAADVLSIELLHDITTRIGETPATEPPPTKDAPPTAVQGDAPAAEPTSTGDAPLPAAAGDAAAGDKTDDQTGDPKGDAGKDGDDKREVQLPPEVQEILDRRIGKEVRKRKELEEALENERAYASELKSKLDEAGTAAPAVTDNSVHPLMLVGDERELMKRERQIDEFETWAMKHWDGYEGADEKTDPSWTAEQIRETYATLRRERDRVIPQARALMAEKSRVDEAIGRKAYPALYDQRHKDHQIAQAFLRVVPSLRLLPNAMVLIGDMLAGERARVSGSKSTGAVPAAPARPPAAPRVPLSGASAGPQADAKPTQINVADFVARGATSEALVQQVANLL
jgi:hypothetical protein